MGVEVVVLAFFSSSVCSVRTLASSALIVSRALVSRSCEEKYTINIRNGGRAGYLHWLHDHQLRVLQAVA